MERKLCKPFRIVVKTLHSSVQFSTSPSVTAAASKPPFPRTKPHCNVCTVGYSQHGKTTLTAAITKVLCEKNLAKEKKVDDLHLSPKEKDDKMTIQPAKVDYFTEKRHYAHWDCPANNRYVKNSFPVLLQMHSAIFVTSVTDKSLDDTIRSLSMLQKLGLKELIVFLNKADIAKQPLNEQIEMLEAVIQDMGFVCGPIVAGSALAAIQGKDDEIGRNSIIRLLNGMDECINIPVPKLDRPFFLPVDRVYQVKGHGTVVSGTLKQGKMKVQMESELQGFGMKIMTKISGLESFDKILEEGYAGDHIFAMVSKVDRDEAVRGMVLTEPKSYALTDHIEVEWSNVTENKTESAQISNFGQMQMFCNTWETRATVLLDDKDGMPSGETTRAVLHLDKPMNAEVDDRFIFYNGKDIVVNGVVKKIHPNRTEEEKEAAAKILKAKKKEKKVAEMHMKAH